LSCRWTQTADGAMCFSLRESLDVCLQAVAGTLPGRGRRIPVARICSEPFKLPN